MGITEGTALASQSRTDPPLHIVEPGGGGWVTLCTGAPCGLKKTIRRRRCVSCTAQLRFLVGINQATQQDLDVWLSSTNDPMAYL